MQKFVSLSKKIVPVTLLMLALVLALPAPTGAQDAMEDAVFAGIRIYEGLDPDTPTEAYLESVEGFVEIIRQSEGFVGYYWMHSVDTVVAITLFATEEQATASNEAAREHVAEHASDLARNPPRIVEGVVDIGFVEMLAGMGEGNGGSLHASVRIYDGFHADDLDEFVGIVEDGFLPIMRETEGFFGYYLMHDDAGALVAVSIFDSEASALASNENARDFVAEYLTAYLPSDPLIASGRVPVAALADVNMGANLIDDMTMDQDVFVSIRVYDGVDAADRDEIVRLVDPEFLSIVSESEGFVAYYLLPAGDMLASVNMFDSAEQAAASNEKAREYVAEYMAPLLPNAPRIVEGTIDVMYVADGEDMMMDDMGSLYASLRIYDNANLENRDEDSRTVRAYLLPALIKAGGLFSYFTLNDGVDVIAALNVYDSKDTALAANRIAAAFVAELAATRLPDDPLRVVGELGVAALAEMHMGENLVGAMMDG